MTQTDADHPVVAGLVVEVATAVSRRAAEVSEDVCKLILREIPQLDDDRPLVALLASSVDSNVATCLQILQHQIDLAAVPAPASAVEYARRLAQRGLPLTALLRAYRSPRRWSRRMPRSGRTGCGSAVPPGPPGSVTCCRASGST